MRGGVRAPVPSTVLVAVLATGLAAVLAAGPAAGLPAAGLSAAADEVPPPGPDVEHRPLAEQEAQRTPVPASFVLTGGGFGHGVGMSQYGAQAQALAGRSARQILTYYYTGASVAAARDDADIRVEILGATRSARVTSASLAGAAGGRFQVRVGTATLAGRPGDTLTLVPVPAGVRATLTPGAGSGSGAQAASGATAVVRWQGTRALRGGATVLDVPGAGGRYRHGVLEVLPIGSRLSVVNVLRLHDEYLAGIAEVPSSWAAAALQAQAVAARTYAIRAMGTGVRASCGCHLYDEVRSQKFTGWRHEGEPRWGARWVAAVRATAPTATTGRIVTYGGRPAETLYFSSDGGRTENSEDVWSARVPYLRSVPDPWSARAGNPMALWTRTVSQARMAAAFGLRDVAVLDLSDRTAGGGVRSARAVSSTGATARIPGSRFTGRLGLPARWVFREVQRVAGRAGWSRSLAIGAAAAPGASTAVLVSAAGDGVWDGVAAAPLARALRAPLLVVPRGTAAASVAASLGGRRVTTAVLVGAVAGPARPGPLVAALQAEGVSVTRLAGADRFATAALVAEQVVARSADPAGSRRAVVVPTDGATPDAALAAAAVAAGTGRPVLLTRARTLPAATSGAVTALGIASAVCVGSAAELSDAVARALPACRRVASADPVQLGTRLAGTVRPASPWTAVTLAVPGPGGTADAVAAAALGRPLLRVGPRAPSVAVRWLQTARSVGRLTVVGDVPGGAVRALQRA